MRGLALGLLTLVVAACAGSGAAAPTPTPTGTFAGFDVTVTERDHAATVAVGQRLQLVLRAAPGMTDWQDVRSSDTSVLMAVPHPGATSVRGTTLAAFLAVRRGTTDVTATAGVLCSPGAACPALAALFKVTITVT